MIEHCCQLPWPSGLCLSDQACVRQIRPVSIIEHLLPSALALGSSGGLGLARTIHARTCVTLRQVISFKQRCIRVINV
jgi:hypothetical protein